MNKIYKRPIFWIGIFFVASLLWAIILGDMVVLSYNNDSYPYYHPILCWLLGIALLLTLGFFTFIRFHESKQKSTTPKEKLALLIQNTCSGSFLDICFVLAFLVILDWLPNVSLSYIEGTDSILRIVPYTLGLGFLFLGKPTIHCESEIGDDERKVIVSGMSHIKIFKSGKCSIETLIDPFRAFPNIEKLVIHYTNNMVYKNEFEGPIPNDNIIALKTENAITALTHIADNASTINPLQNEMDVVRKYILSCIQTIDAYKNKNVEIVFSNPVNYNLFEECNQESVRLINREVISDKSYSDRNVVVNITPGTSIVTSVMTLNSIKEDRILVYVDQSTYKLGRYDAKAVSLLQFDDWKKDAEGNG